MSLESEIQELTAAVKVLTIALLGDKLYDAGEETAEMPEEPNVAIAVEHVETVEAVEVKEVKKHTPDVTTPKLSKAPEITYDDVKKHILAISSKSRDSAVELLAIFGATSGPKLREEQYAKFVVAAEAVLVKLNSDE